MSVTVNALTKLYGTQKAIDALSFSINKGEIVGLLGPNGSGKSTTMKILTCFLPQSSGEATVCGYDVAKNSNEIRRIVGYLPENNPLYLDMYVKEYLSYVGGIYKVPNLSKRIAELVELTGLGVEQHKKIGQLSKGYRQRVGIAQTLVHNPEVLILDEPTTGLDPNQLVEIRKLIQEISYQKTIILSTHIMQEVEALCKRVIIVNQGKLVADAPTEQLQNQTNTQNLVEVSFDGAVQKSQLEKINGVLKAQNIGANKWLVSAKTSQDLNGLLFDFAVQNQVRILNMNKQENSLEDVFRNLTTKK